METLETKRFVLIDALRGLAALGVLLYHLTIMSALTPALRRAFGAGTALLELGEYGVQIFFVLSGFVIAHSLRDQKVSRREMGNFIVRRQLRLDPPYWSALVITLVLKWIGLHSAPDMAIKAFPSARDIGSNFFYLHAIARVEPILLIAWTLCLEIQFYLVFIVLMRLSAPGRRERITAARQDIPQAAMLIVLLGMASLGMALFGGRFFGGDRAAWFIHFWHFFASGALCYWAWCKLINPAMFWGWMSLIGAAILIAGFLKPEPIIVLHGSERVNSPLGLGVEATVVLLIYFSGKSGKIWSWGRGRVFQYLGKISYSLYLVHVTVLAIVMRVGYKLTGDRPLAAVLWFIVTGLLCIPAAHALHVLVERPSMRWASRFKRPERPAEVLLPPIAAAD